MSSDTPNALHLTLSASPLRFAAKDSKASKENVRVSVKLLDELRPTVVFSMSSEIDGFTLTLYTVMGEDCALGHVR